MAVELVNPVPAGEIGAWARTMATAFQRDPDGPDAGQHLALLQDRWDSERAWGGREGGRWVASRRR